jgi:hypothetical protein
VFLNYRVACVSPPSRINDSEGTAEYRHDRVSVMLWLGLDKSADKDSFRKIIALWLAERVRYLTVCLGVIHPLGEVVRLPRLPSSVLPIVTSYAVDQGCVSARAHRSTAA